MFKKIKEIYHDYKELTIYLDNLYKLLEKSCGKINHIIGKINKENKEYKIVTLFIKDYEIKFVKNQEVVEKNKDGSEKKATVNKIEKTISGNIKIYFSDDSDIEYNCNYIIS